MTSFSQPFFQLCTVLFSYRCLFTTLFSFLGNCGTVANPTTPSTILAVIRRVLLPYNPFTRDSWSTPTRFSGVLSFPLTLYMFFFYYRLVFYVCLIVFFLLIFRRSFQVSASPILNTGQNLYYGATGKMGSNLYWIQ